MVVHLPPILDKDIGFLQLKLSKVMKKNYFSAPIERGYPKKYLKNRTLTGILCLSILFQGVVLQATGNTVEPADVAASYFSNPAQRPVTIQVKDVTIKHFLDELQRAADVDILYSSADLPAGIKVTLNYTGATVEEVLRRGLEKTDLTFQVKDNSIIIYKGQAKPAVAKPRTDEKITVKGVVADENGEPLPGAYIMLKSNDKLGTAADENGAFELEIPRQSIGRDALLVSFVGMKGEEIKLDKKGGYMITMSPEALEIENLIVTGYQTLSKERATGSFAVVSQKDLEGKLQTNIMERLNGTVPGLTSYRGNLQIRGVSTINGISAPLYVVDGAPFEGAVSALNPSDIVNVTVLKDATAASIYGARSANGVIVITTKNGTSGPAKVIYNGSIRLEPLFDTDYNNLMNSREFVDFQEKLFNLNPGTNQKGYYMNEVRAALFAHKEGTISAQEKDRILNMYRNRDRKEQSLDLFIRTPAINHQHNLGVTGGSEKYNYALSLNFNQNLPYEKNTSTERVGFNLKNNLIFNKWFKANIGIIGTLTDSDYDNGYSGLGHLTGQGKASYLLYYDEQGNELPWYVLKDQAEMDRLKGEGLLDESYYPLRERDKRHFKQNDKYINFNVNLNFKIIEGLTLDLRYQQDFGSNYFKQYNSKDAYSVRSMINNATQIKNGEIIKNIPDGGQVEESRFERDSYTLRAQLNYTREIAEKHLISVIAGAERRKVRSSGTSVFKVGYDDQSLAYKVIDEKMLGSQLKGTESLSGTFNYSDISFSPDFTPGFKSNEDRYVSFYGNASYTFNSRATVTASIRMDQSNLFGTDPKYQYRPLWSVGGQYVIVQNKKWLDRLVGRLTYGINGNVPKVGGPYLTVSSGGVNDWINDYQSVILFPPNSGLRWEKTEVLNVAVDFDLFGSRLNGSLEFYNKNTTDLLYSKKADPTYGWNSVMVNYGDMYNRGVEIMLNSRNIVKKDFSWNTSFNFSYNKNKVTRIEESKTNAIDYINGTQIRAGKPLRSLYSVRWAGLSEKDGSPQAYTKDGKLVNSFANLTAEDLVYSGVTTPPYAAFLSNQFKYKNLGLSFMFSYYGGHVLRGVFGNYLINTGYSVNQDRLTGNFWEKPGDEKDPSKAPAFKMGASQNMQNLWKAADKHIQRGDYIKLEEIILDYSLPQSLLQKTFLKQVRFTFQMQNVWKWVANDLDLDPEVWQGTSLSPSRGSKKPATYTFGLSVNF